MWAKIINTVLGIWMMLAPAVLKYDYVAAKNAYITGPLIASFAIIAMSESVRNVKWLNLPIGIWLISAPWILHFQNLESTFNDSIAGILVILMTLVKEHVKEKFGGGWKVLFLKDKQNSHS